VKYLVDSDVLINVFRNNLVVADELKHLMGNTIKSRMMDLTL
jgi:hypothetical protein